MKLSQWKKNAIQNAPQLLGELQQRKENYIVQVAKWDSEQQGHAANPLNIKHKIASSKLKAYSDQLKVLERQIKTIKELSPEA